MVVTLSHGIGVNTAPPTKSSPPGVLEASGVDEPFKRRPLALAIDDPTAGRGKTFAGLETESTRSRARRYDGKVR